MCVEEGRGEVVVSSGVVLQSGTLAVWNFWERTKQMGAPLLWASGSRLTPPPLSLKHGAILRDQNEAGTDSLVWTQQTDTKSVCELPAGCETHRKWTFSSPKADSCRGGVSIPTCIEWETHLMLDFKCFSSVCSHGTHKKHHHCFISFNFSYLFYR